MDSDDHNYLIICRHGAQKSHYDFGIFQKYQVINNETKFGDILCPQCPQYGTFAFGRGDIFRTANDAILSKESELAGVLKNKERFEIKIETESDEKKRKKFIKLFEFYKKRVLFLSELIKRLGDFKERGF